MSVVPSETRQARAHVRELSVAITKAHLEDAAWEVDHDDAGVIVAARWLRGGVRVAAADEVLKPLVALWQVIKRSEVSLHLILEVMKEVVDGKCKSALRSVATICAPDLVVSVVTRADLIANWRLAGSTYDQFIRAFDPDRRLLLQLGVSTPDVHLSAQAELQSWVDTQPNASDERMWKLLRLGAAAAESVGRAFPATAGVASASELARILVPPWVRTLAPDEPFPLELHPLVRFLDGDEIALILAKTPMAHRAPLLRRLPVRLLNVNEQILALAPPEILAMLAEESTNAAADASQTARRRAAAPYRFVDPVRVLPGDYARLDDVAKSQWRTAAGAYVESGTVRDPQDFVRQLAKEGLNEGDAQLQYWKVLRGNNHVFDLWVVWVENGSFFVAGQRDRVFVHIVQGRFIALEDTPEAHALAADLGDSQRVSLWDLATCPPVYDEKGATMIEVAVKQRN